MNLPLGVEPMLFRGRAAFCATVEPCELDRVGSVDDMFPDMRSMQHRADYEPNTDLVRITWMVGVTIVDPKRASFARPQPPRGYVPFWEEPGALDQIFGAPEAYAPLAIARMEAMFRD